MHRIKLVVLLAIVFASCSTFKELSPDPELSPAERGYIELKDGKDNFALDKGGKYFMKFPKPERDKFYVVMKLSPKSALDYYFTQTFDDGKGAIEKIRDDAAPSDSISAFAVNPSYIHYYWVIENVRSDVELTMKYRYVPHWRFMFENKYASSKQILDGNAVDRTTYNAIDRNFSFSGFKFSEKLAQLDGATNRLRTMRDDMKTLDGLFPPEIISSRDTAYESYKMLRRLTDDEIQFQENYHDVLKAFRTEQETQGDVGRFLAAAPQLAEFASQKSRFPERILDKARDAFGARLAPAENYYDEKLQTKNNAKPIAFDPPIANAKQLYDALDKPMPADFRSMLNFVERYNDEADALQSVNSLYAQTDNALSGTPAWTSEALYADLLGKVASAKAKTPESKAAGFGKFGGYTCAQLLANEVRIATARASLSENLYTSAQNFARNLNATSWSAAEDALRDIHYNTSYASVAAVNVQKQKIERAFENELFSRVKQISQQRVDAFVKANEAAIDDVPKLYRDSAFTPVHQINFSILGSDEVTRKRGEVQNYIDKLKFNEFPAASIKAIYRDFTRDINSRGVERARAIVEHGKFYKGDDKTLRSMVSECDPTVAKWISKTKEYRKQYALPVTNNKRGVNEYMFRTQLQIPTEAQFPVYEINVKLPKEVAEKARQQQWFESITINKQPIKNEGRFSITAPTADNDYESQIAPVQMDKEGRNVLEIRFKYPGYKVFEVSTMAQVPIIRKN
jgi:hypothetical protein